MTIDQFITKYDGEKVGDGECGSLVRQYLIEVDGYTPPSHPSAKDYWTDGMPGYDKVATPQQGDIAVYDEHGIYTDGHIAIYYDGRVFEQNADPDGSPAHLFNRANTYLLGYLRKQGEDMQPATFEEAQQLSQTTLLRPVPMSREEWDQYHAAANRTYQQLNQDWANTQEAKDQRYKCWDYDPMVKRLTDQAGTGYSAYTGTPLFTKNK